MFASAQIISRVVRVPSTTSHSVAVDQQLGDVPGQERAVGLGQHHQVAGGLEQATAGGVPVTLLRLVTTRASVLATSVVGAGLGVVVHHQHLVDQARGEEAFDHRRGWSPARHRSSAPRTRSCRSTSLRPPRLGRAKRPHTRAKGGGPEGAVDRARCLHCRRANGSPRVIAFGSAITKPELYRRCAEPGLRVAAEAGLREMFAFESIGSIFQSYNRVLDGRRGARRPRGAGAAAPGHRDRGLRLLRQVREALREPDVGLAGCVGAIGVRSIAWWEGSVTLASFIHRYPEHGGGDLPAFSWAWAEAPPYARLGEVETLDGFLLVLSPWVVRNVRFDESLGAFHGYDLDFSSPGPGGREEGRDGRPPAIHHHPLESFSDPQEWIDAHVKVARSGTAACPASGRTRGRHVRESAPCGPRESATPPARDGSPRGTAEGPGRRVLDRQSVALAAAPPAACRGGSPAPAAPRWSARS